ncbi:Ribonuclease D [Austwickia sp. TVS 96-490-7B]|uniref:HRDC domain-containing protein n=1 Tax=Austwickia sp. TVS 96-490-7B TaxID=2830843 RepID=UPI001C58F059|nr:HRDC domain-containing protein [Austwickia sp. TVS 96-490-7B]MBW3086374.1 Ribonuclease D [Austwickia sp. TVS 96-490-7B]
MSSIPGDSPSPVGPGVPFHAEAERVDRQTRSARHTRRRTRASRADLQQDLARRRGERTAEQAPHGPEITDETTPEDLGMPRLISHPAEGIPPVVAQEDELEDAARRLAGGTGPVAVDAERASGYRYGQRAYLVQLRRAGAGTFLIDPVACPQLSPLQDALADVEWVVHAATQDLPCLAEVGLTPSRLFDTELGARLAGLPRVGLAAVLEHYLDVTLAKEHSAVDWSTRPLPEPWLRYAALDVEILVELRDRIEQDLQDQGKLAWAQEEFTALTSFTGPPPRIDPWRRLSGLHRLRGRRTLAIARALWYARDDLARQRDISPGRVIPDAPLLEIAQAAPRTSAAVAEVTSNRAARRHALTWAEAVRSALELPEDALPAITVPSSAPPPPRTWADRDPVAAARLAWVRAQLAVFAAEQRIPVENILAPDTVRRVLWNPPEAIDDEIREALSARGARPWQIAVVTPLVRHALTTPAEQLVVEPPATESAPAAAETQHTLPSDPVRSSC